MLPSVIAVLACAAQAGAGLAQPAPEYRIAVAGGSLSYYGLRPPDAEGARPLLLVVPAGLERAAAEAAVEEWRGAAATRGWALAVPHGRLPGGADWADGTVRFLEAVLADATVRLKADPERVYLAASGGAVSAAFYAASRTPHLFAAVAALGGNPREAIETNRLFGANNALTPVLWAGGGAAAEAALRKLGAAGYNVVARPAEQATPETVAAWLAEHQLNRFPAKVDCETGSLAFGRCYWLQITKFDPAQRNDVLPVSRVPPSSGAYLELGRFSYSLEAAGPGVLVEQLPEGYRGPLRAGDRIVALGGRALRDAAEYEALMDQMTGDKPIAVMVERGKQRMRLETRVLLPKREENFTARVQAEWLPDAGELLVISRGLGELRMELPAGWVPVRVNWNGEEAGTAAAAGCWRLVPGSPLSRCVP